MLLELLLSYAEKCSSLGVCMVCCIFFLRVVLVWFVMVCFLFFLFCLFLWFLWLGFDLVLDCFVSLFAERSYWGVKASIQ